jgi:hypothetical protein
MSLSVMGSVRALDILDPNEYSVSGVREYGGRRPGENLGEETMSSIISLVFCRQ